MIEFVSNVAPDLHLITDVCVFINGLDRLALDQGGVPAGHRFDSEEQLLQQQPLVLWNLNFDLGLVLLAPWSHFHITCQLEYPLSIYLLDLKQKHSWLKSNSPKCYNNVEPT